MNKQHLAEIDVGIACPYCGLYMMKCEGPNNENELVCVNQVCQHAGARFEIPTVRIWEILEPAGDPD